jgi:MtfA peptidase
MFGRLKSLRRERAPDRGHPVRERVWRRVIEDRPLFDGLAAPELGRLRELTAQLIGSKQITGAGGQEIDDKLRLTIAAQACLPIVNLGIEYYRGWNEIIVYPDEFVPLREYTDEAGVVHQTRHPLAGESWLGGPLILSWADAGHIDDGAGINVVIHEFAHKLDMLNGDANGYPPLHANMQREIWARVFTSAYENFCRRVDAGEETTIDPYASENPGEFFAVLSEVFFANPAMLLAEYPAPYEQLTLFYRQDPGARQR